LPDEIHDRIEYEYCVMRRINKRYHSYSENRVMNKEKKDLVWRKKKRKRKLCDWMTVRREENNKKENSKHFKTTREKSRTAGFSFPGETRT